jgi:hypothetical protein
MKKRKKRRRSSGGKIRSILPPPGVSAAALAKAIQKDKFFARVTRDGKIVTNAPIR